MSEPLTYNHCVQSVLYAYYGVAWAPLRFRSSRWLFFANRGEFRTGDYEEIMNKASCLSLLSNAVLVWNTIEMAKIVERLKASGEEIAAKDLARVSPMAFHHVIPNGTYHFNRVIRRDDFAYDALM